MSTALVKPEAVALITTSEGDAPLPISEGSVTLDENYSPYAQATLVVPLADLSVLEQIDPREDQRVVLQAWDATLDPTGAEPREFALGLRERRVDHKAGTVTLELASDEAKLMDRRNVSTAVDSTPRTHEASLRAVCSWALDKIGATLQAGTTEADLTAYWPITNLVTNPRLTTNATAWQTGSGASAGARVVMTTPLPPVGTAAYRWTAATGDSNVVPLASRFRVTPGKWYVFTAYICSGTTRQARAAIQWWSAGNVLSSTSFGTLISSNVSSFQHVYVIAKCPPGAEEVVPYINTIGNAAGNLHYGTMAMFYEGTELVDYFDGSTADTANYIYDWQADANVSTSTRTPVVERSPELFDWRPGMSLYDFLKPLLAASNLRLFCDELGVWRLVDPATYAVPGYVVVQSGHNATEGSDTISRNTEDWADAVVCVYTWTDREGSTQTAYDAAGDPEGKTILREIDREFPGPGAAQRILDSLTGRGRVQDVTALVNFDATPGNDVTINLPGTLTQTGKVRRVRFGLSQGRMELGTRGLTDALAGSWATWPPDETWSEVTPTLKWKDA